MPDKCEVALEEYRQLCEYHRHDDQMKWTILGLTYTAAGALVGLSLSKAPALNAGTFIASILGIAFIVAGTAIYHDINHDTKLRLVRLHELEGTLDIRNHRVFDCPKDAGKAPSVGVNRIVTLLAVFFTSVVAILLLGSVALRVFR